MTSESDKLAVAKRGMLEFQQPLVWRNIIGILILHVVAIYSCFSVFTEAKLITILWSYGVGYMSGLGVTAGAHRLWTHKAYKAKLPLRIFLMFCFLLAGQYSMVQWARDHRLHHKFSDTDADPHNINRGLFFSHCGWLMMKRHPEVKDKGKTIDLSDLWQDPVVRFQQKYFIPLLVICIIFPSVVPYYFWNESLKHVVLGTFFIRYTIQLNSTWLVNSVAHMYGYRPYNKSIKAVQSKFVANMTLGEGWHNFHHAFPWDYRIGELGQGSQSAAFFIELFAKLGLAYDLKSVTPEMVAKVIAKNNSKPCQSSKGVQSHLNIEQDQMKFKSLVQQSDADKVNLKSR